MLMSTLPSFIPATVPSIDITERGTSILLRPILAADFNICWINAQARYCDVGCRSQEKVTSMLEINVVFPLRMRCVNAANEFEPYFSDRWPVQMGLTDTGRGYDMTIRLPRVILARPTKAIARKINKPSSFKTRSIDEYQTTSPER